MNKHTPGPWELRHERHLGKTDHVVKIGTASVYFNRGIGQTEQNAISNARLIAAAPELLEALERLCVVVGAYDNGQMLPTPIVDAASDARLAIAKARGL